MVTARATWDPAVHHTRRLEPLLDDCPWILRITEWADRPPPLFIVKERVTPEAEDNGNGTEHAFDSRLYERGRLYGEALRRCTPVMRAILGRIRDDAGIPLELEQYLSAASNGFRGNLPLDVEAGAKLALIFKLRERVDELDRVELIARRVDRFTREEATYWHSRITHFGKAPSRWAQAGMRIMLGGQPGDPAVEEMLERLRAKGGK